MGSLYVLIKGRSPGTQPGSKSGRIVGTNRYPGLMRQQRKAATKRATAGMVESEYRGEEPCNAYKL
jgi:hypothetical protein